MLKHELQLKNSSKSRPKKRVGRGGRRGTFSGRGTKGQKARSGHKIRPAERDLIQRLPKFRGLGKNKNRRKSPANFVLNLRNLNKLNFTDISKKTLLEHGIIKPTFSGKVKILSLGETAKSFTINKDILISATAVKKITAAGGAILND